MKKISAILAMVLVLAMTVMPVSANDVSFSLTGAETVEPGAEFELTVEYSPASATLAAADIVINFDTTKVSYVSYAADASTTDSTITPNVGSASTGSITLGAYSLTNWTGKVLKVKFKALETVSGSTTIDLEVKNVADNDFNDYSATSVDKVITIGSEPDPEPAVFAVKANLDTDGKVVVTAENIGKNVGTVYVATYNEGVLVDCEAKALADIADGWTVENLDGTAADAQIFVWNDQNVPLFDNVITVTAE